MSREEGPGRMSQRSGAGGTGAVILEEPEPAGTSGSSVARADGPAARDRGPLGCALWWPRQQTWLCMVPLLIGFIGLGLSLMLLKWIVVGTVRDYVPTDLVDANRIGQDPIFLSKPSGLPKGPETTTTATTTGATIAATPTVDHALKSVTVGRGRTRSTATTAAGANPRTGVASGGPAPPRKHANRNGRLPVAFTAPPRTNLRTSTPSASNPTVLHDSTQMWTSEHTTAGGGPTTTTTTVAHRRGHHKTPSPTMPPLHSEHFKPCHDKDLAYCLNGGECFVIETLSGPHKHCKCREGYQGIRCDQFLPKTDSILSDPNHLGIEFMESKEVYQRQLLSITSIAMAIGLLGVLCVVLYCRNKRRREKLQAHLKESRSVKNYTTNVNSVLDSKTRNGKADIRMQQYCKRPPACRHSDMCEPPSRSTQKLTTEQRSVNWSAASVPRGRPKAFHPSYHHLREAELTEREVEAPRSCIHQEEPRRPEPRPEDPVNMQFALNTRSQADGGPPTRRSASVPMVPSVRGRHDDEVSCMQTAMMSSNAAAPRQEGAGDGAAGPRGREDGERQAARLLLLREASENLRASARGRQEEGAAPVAIRARETVCLLNFHVGGASKATHTQLLREPDQ
ncbi:pro-neuregulin-3, membrane-bound isoform-like isoform X2 [Hippocampus zosterae]|uniref:pro-neuregulin-3, membrane-bound isoform-like isoform X2 n=1 Tax=Hippocampus zosterae TaxID=109293 RepID=UPI00223E2F12|nr:pro-neuregulin-3, membrane-bound isoform-like isoform X2 [Hippocampus zosterae]